MASKIILIIGASTAFGNITAKLLAENRHRVDATIRKIKSTKTHLGKINFKQIRNH